MRAREKKISGPGPAFIMRGLKRLYDSQALYAQVVVTTNCNLSCAYCNEYRRGATPPPLTELKARIDRLHRLGVMVFDLLGGEPLLNKDLVPLVRHIKGLGRGNNIVTIITNGFLLTPKIVDELGETGLDMMQISVDSARPTESSDKALSLLMPRLKMLARRARFKVKVQSVLTEQTCGDYGKIRELLDGLPFDFGFSLLHGPGGRVAIEGQRYVRLLREEKLFAGMNLYRRHAEEALLGDFSRPWKCLGGSKFLYVNGGGEVQFCSQNQTFSKALGDFTTLDIRGNNRHKPCEPGCVLGCARLISHALGEPLKTMKTSLSILAGLHRQGGGGPENEGVRQ
ncbi:MAG: radical SAM protein [Thermodesulfobacteriota bacterium]